MNARRRVTGELGNQEDAEEWLKNYMEERRRLNNNERQNYLPLISYILGFLSTVLVLFNSLSKSFFNR
jgi:hypothetical protein